jgi:hypothetical protein
MSRTIRLSPIRNEAWSLGSPLAVPTRPDSAGGVVTTTVVPAVAGNPANCGAAGSAAVPSPERSPGALAAGVRPAAPTDATPGVLRLVVVVVALAAGLVVVGEPLVGRVVVTEVVGVVAGVVGGLVTTVVVGHRCKRGMQTARRLALAGTEPAQTAAVLATAAAITATVNRRIVRSIDIGAATLPWRCDRDQHYFAGPDRSPP